MEEHGLQFIELRALGGRLDLVEYFTQNPVHSKSAKVQVIASSLCLRDVTARDFEQFYELAALADKLNAPYIRVFGAKKAEVGSGPSEQDLVRLADTVRSIQETLIRRKIGCEVLLETHDIFSSSDRCVTLNRYLAVPIKILWDSHHTWRLSAESPQETWRKLGHLVAHIHYKDSIPSVASGENNYVIPGYGEYPAKDLVSLLIEAKFTGGVSLEWEKLWHPELRPIEQALPAFTKQFSC